MVCYITVKMRHHLWWDFLPAVNIKSVVLWSHSISLVHVSSTLRPLRLSGSHLCELVADDFSDEISDFEQHWDPNLGKMFLNLQWQQLYVTYGNEGHFWMICYAFKLEYLLGYSLLSNPLLDLKVNAGLFLLWKEDTFALAMTRLCFTSILNWTFVLLSSTSPNVGWESRDCNSFVLPCIYAIILSVLLVLELLGHAHGDPRPFKCKNMGN